MLELLQCLQLSGKKGEIARNASDILIILYFLSYLLNRKGFYIGAFLAIEFIGSSFLLESYSDLMFYAFISSAFALCYWYEVAIGKNIKILCAYGIMVLFQSMMVMDAYFYPDVITSIYQAYEFVIVGIHIYIIIVLIEPRKLVKTMGNSVNWLSNFLGIGYSLSFCYNVNIIRNKTQKPCLQITKK
jgi:hypothetical protein